MANELADLLGRVERIEPWLRRRTWPPLTYMMIPSVLASAANIIRGLALIDAPEAKRALTRVYELRLAFRRER